MMKTNIRKPPVTISIYVFPKHKPNNKEVTVC